MATDARKNGASVGEMTPPIFCEDNRVFWLLVRRFMIHFLRELDKAYGWDTIK